MFNPVTHNHRWLTMAVGILMAVSLPIGDASAKGPPPRPQPLTHGPPRAHVERPDAIRCDGAMRSYRCAPTLKRILAMQDVKQPRGGTSSLRGLAAKCRAHQCARHRHGRDHQGGGRRVLYSASDSTTGADARNSGGVMTGGQYLTTANGQYKLVMQGDGNLVLYTANFSRALWASNTANHPGSRAVMQTDGNLVIYGPSNEVLFASNTAGKPGASLVAQTDGNVVIYSSQRQPLWASNTVNSGAGPGDVMTAGQYLTTANGQYKLVMQGDGNLVLYTANFSRALWASNTAGHSGARTAMQTDGNLVIYGPSNEVLFATGTWGKPGSSLSAQSDGNVVLYNPSHQPLWNSGTVNWAAGANDVLYPGWYLSSLANGYHLVMQSDGNLVMYRTNGSVRWHSNTPGNPGARAVMQSDGNFVVYTASNAARFNTGTWGHPGSVLAVQGDGNLVVYEGSRPLWWIGMDRLTPSDDYPDSLRGPKDSRVDPWGFYNRECTSFVAWKLNSYGFPFSNGMRGGRFGNAYQWADNARNLGYAVNGNPTPGSVAWWGQSSTRPYGHVALVDAVNPDGTVQIEQYNANNAGTYSTATVRADAYLHIWQ
ncbi:MAG TPA: CHAP domain-containing protein [Thermoleophilaceae bacterium]|nr:CHAP domain-containing protein [Thermoleophilaceae bacterium]